MKIPRLFIAAAAMLTASEPALGCFFTPVVEIGDRPRSEAERAEAARLAYDRQALARLEAADALVEVVALTPVSEFRAGSVRVLRSYKGDIAPGTELSFRATPETDCGGGTRFDAGSRGLILIDDRSADPLYFHGYLSIHDFALFHRAGRLASIRQ